MGSFVVVIDCGRSRDASGASHEAWGADRIGYQLEQDGVGPVPGRTSIYRALVRNGLVSPGQRKRRRADYRRWERARPMELWQTSDRG